MEDNTNSNQVVSENLAKVLVWLKNSIIVPTPNPKAMFSFAVRYSTAVALGVGYAWVVNPVVYVGANIRDLPIDTQLPVVLGLSQILFAVRGDAYSVGKVIEVINMLGINNYMLCETQAEYGSFVDIMSYVVQLLGASC